MTFDLSEDLKQVIDRYLAGHKTRSLATLSRISGVSYTTLRRFSQREGTPTAEPVLKILDATLATQEKIAFLEKHFPEIARTIARFADRPGREVDPARENLKMFYRRDPHNLILNLAINVHGTDVETVRRLMGERGLEALDELVECEVLERDYQTDAIRYKDDTVVCTDSDFLFDQIRHSVDYFDRSMLGSGLARLAHITASVNHEGLSQVHRILTEALTQISAINEDPKYCGRVPYFVGALMNVYDKKPLQKDEEKDKSNG